MIKLERWHINACYALAGLVAGAGCGYLLGVQLSRRRFDRQLDAELAAIKAHYRAAAAASVAQQKPRLDDLRRAAAAMGTDTGDAGDDQDPAEESEGEEVSGADRGDALHDEDVIAWPPVGRDRSKPYIISLEEFCEPIIGYQQLTITYYATDDVLVDDKEAPIRDVRGTVGPISALGFGGVSRDPCLRYVRNERLELDFEIVLDPRAYTDAVLNYGNPHREKGSAPLMFRQRSD